MRLIVHAVNVHGGGGLTVLQAALEGIPVGQHTILLADSRLPIREFPAHVSCWHFPPTIAGRLRAERHLQAIAEPSDQVVCLGNLPPLLPCRGRVAVYLHNRLLCGPVSLRGFPLALRLRLFVERHWLRNRLSPGMRLYVQTESMRLAARRGLGVDAIVAPFVGSASPNTSPPAPVNRARLLYPAAGAPHKNHHRLLSAIRLLHDAGVQVELHLTVEPESPIVPLIEAARDAGCAVVNHGRLDTHQMQALYHSAPALIFPSLTESFGLPLVEAKTAGLVIIASERDFVRDVVEPDHTFDPDSALSIARAIRRHLGSPEVPRTPMHGADFIRLVVSG